MMMGGCRIRPPGCHAKPVCKASACKCPGDRRDSCTSKCKPTSCTCKASNARCKALCCKIPVERRDLICSPHCKKHTCEHFWELIIGGTDRCEAEKSPQDSVCKLHVRCQAPDCMNGRMQYWDSAGPTPQYRRWRYCCSHKCSSAVCPNRCAVVLLGQYHRYCDDHKCRARGCPEEATNNTSHCCQRHTCTSPGCMSMAENNSVLCTVRTPYHSTTRRYG
ncbi:uncharacterized protein GGS25DRAFT_161453 [Hypoxylon fragiforme]|uniref:uncharacterized protein n=1 Tax=Hypoxylon fragiforme TaxID=63214 RepID=UPI0020C6FF6D|nr:uncharacterized protein GGS25DRAFT_161453 [Hypoxylon fragiforme]KAI2610732.1 hypothetical protein GGS25DRAFT_161453 [Hypoxylon fragiforme]